MEGIEAGGVPVFAVWRSPAAEWAERAAALRRRVSSRLDCDERKRPLGPVVTGKIGANDLADSSIDQVGNVDTSIYTCSEFSPWVVSQVMKRFMVVHASKAEIGEGVFARLRGIVPGESSTTFHAKLRDDSAEYAEVLRTLQAAGCVARGKFEESRPGTFLLQPNYEYEKADFDRASYFLMLPHADVKLAGGRAPDGTVALQANGLAGKGPLLIGIPWVLLVSAPLRADLEAAGFAGLAFRSTRVVRSKSNHTLEEIPWRKVGCEPYWELTASVDLPPLSPRCRLVNEKGERIQNDDWSGGVFLMEDQFPAGELHYRKSDLLTIPPFDFALTHEPLDMSRPSPYHRRLVLSRRVHDFIRARRLKVSWLPVYVDDE